MSMSIICFSKTVCAVSVFFKCVPSAMNFPFIMSHRFEYVVSLFSLNLRKTLISFLFFSILKIMYLFFVFPLLFLFIIEGSFLMTKYS